MLFDAVAGKITWTPGNSDVGTHTVTLKASDGLLDDIQTYLITVSNVNDAPVIIFYTPSVLDITAEANQTSTFFVSASDPDPNDTLTFSWSLDGALQSGTEILFYNPTFNDIGNHTLNLTVSDGRLTNSHDWKVEVVDTLGPVVTNIEVVPDPPIAPGNSTVSIDFNEEINQLMMPSVTLGKTEPYESVIINGSFVSSSRWVGTARFTSNDQGSNYINVTGVADLVGNPIVTGNYYSLFIESAEDSDEDGYNNLEELNSHSDPNNPDSRPGATTLTLHKGYNQVSFPAETMHYGDLQNLMEALGGSAVIDKIFIFDPVSQAFTEAGYDVDGFFYGESIALAAGRGLPGFIVYAKQGAVINFTSQYCHTWDLKPGTNLVGSGCIANNFTASDLLLSIGDDTEISSIQRFNHETGTFETMGYEGVQPSGLNFSILPGEGYFIQMKQETFDFMP
ncbi:MAG: hypothetical protein ABIJ97_10045 [Bacteroidota bacterium]